MGKRYQCAGTRPVSNLNPGLVVFAPGPEWLLRECYDCDYGWAEMCADAP